MPHADREKHRKYHEEYRNRRRESIRRYMQKRRDDDPEWSRRTALKCMLKKRGMTLEEWDRMLLKQNGVCAICKGTGRRRALSLDHNHQSGKARGLLCDTCNSGLGMFRDSLENLRSAVEYMERYE